MRLITAFLTVLSLASSIAADGCFNEVKSGPPNCPTPIKDSRTDCSSFLRYTVTPCPTTKTVTNTRTLRPATFTGQCSVTTVIRPTRTLTATQTTFLTTTVTQTSSVTNTVIQTSAFTVTTTKINTDSRTVVTTYTKTLTIDYIPGPQRREDAARALLVAAGSPSCPSTQKPSHIPEYLTSCHGASAYSSACGAAFGIQTTTTVLPRKTVTVTATATFVPTITRGVACTKTQTSSVTVVNTSIVTQLFTATQTRSVTVTNTQTTTNLVTVPITQTLTTTLTTVTQTVNGILDLDCYSFYASSGTIAGSPLQMSDNNVVYGDLAAAPQIFRFDPRNRVYFAEVTNGDPVSFLGAEDRFGLSRATVEELSPAHFALDCDAYTGIFYARYPDDLAPADFFHCSNDLVYVAPRGAKYDGCEVVSIGVNLKVCPGF